MSLNFNENVFLVLGFAIPVNTSNGVRHDPVATLEHVPVPTSLMVDQEFDMIDVDPK